MFPLRPHPNLVGHAVWPLDDPKPSFHGTVLVLLKVRHLNTSYQHRYKSKYPEATQLQHRTHNSALISCWYDSKSVTSARRQCPIPRAWLQGIPSRNKRDVPAQCRTQSGQATDTQTQKPQPIQYATAVVQWTRTAVAKYTQNYEGVLSLVRSKLGTISAIVQVGNVRRLSDDNVEKYIFFHHGRCHKLPQIFECTYQDNFITSNALELAFVILPTWEQQTKTYQ